MTGAIKLQSFKSYTSFLGKSNKGIIITKHLHYTSDCDQTTKMLLLLLPV